MLSTIILYIIFILIAGLFSAIEVAIASFGNNKIEELKEKKDNSFLSFEKIQKEPNIFFGTIQIITTLALFSSVISAIFFLNNLTLFLIKSNYILFLSFSWKLVLTIIGLIFTTAIAIIFGMLVPKAIGFKYSEKIGISFVYFMIFLGQIFRLPVEWITNTSNFFLRPLKERTDFLQTRFSEDEIRIILSEGVKTGAIDETEHEIIENIFEFNDLRANEVMIPRTEIYAVEMVSDEEKMKDEILKSNYSVIPIYVDSVDNIIGILYVKDFMRQLVELNEIKIKNLIKPAFFVPETKLISELLKEMQTRGEKLAIIMDEYGGTEGIITMEDILEEIVGDINDNTNPEINEYAKLPDGKYYVLGSMDIVKFNETFDIELPSSEEYNTVAGFIADKSGKILNTGEVFEYGNLIFELIKKIRQKMVQFKVYSKEGVLEEKRK